jgi:hypothetical protein
MSRHGVKANVAARSTRANPLRAWSWPSVPSTPGAKPALRISKVSIMKAGLPSPTATTMAATAAVRSSARHCSG